MARRQFSLSLLSTLCVPQGLGLREGSTNGLRGPSVLSLYPYHPTESWHSFPVLRAASMFVETPVPASMELLAL